MAKLYKPGCWRELLKLTKDESVCLGDIDTSLITSMEKVPPDKKTSWGKRETV